MLFMIIERFKNGDARPVYERYRDRGRLAPDGLSYVSSWVDTKLTRCYKVMETDDPTLIDRWIANWSDLTDFEVIPVLTSKEAADAVPRMKAPEAPRVEFGGVTPVFRVKSLEDSIDYYVNILGFDVDFRDSNVFASVSRGHVAIFLAEGDQGLPGTWAWIGVSDIEPLFDEYRRKGARIRQPPTNFPWAYEMQIEDPDGHVLRLGSEPKQGMSLGPWLDMNGDRWSRSADGRWLVERRSTR
jgi:catechol 2,3-dioxygenase-like lactoylglutathione lyase family enzyme